MDLQYFKDLLNERELKATTHRLNLLVKMQEYNSAMPYSAIQASMKSIDRVTLYRTLESLQKQGIIHKAYQENNEIYYAVCGMKCKKDQHTHDHLHFKCLSCKLVTCQKTTSHLKIAIPDFEIFNTTVYLEGLCKACKNIKASNIS